MNLCDNPKCRFHVEVVKYNGYNDPKQTGWSNYQYKEGFKSRLRKLDCVGFDSEKEKNYCVACREIFSIVEITTKDGISVSDAFKLFHIKVWKKILSIINDIGYVVFSNQQRIVNLS